MKRTIVIIVVFTIAAAVLFTVAILQPYQGYRGKQIVEIKPGTHATHVATMLASKGIIGRRLPFLLLYAARRGQHGIKAGSYLFDHPLPTLDVYRKLVRGETYTISVVIPEGSNRFDIARIVHASLGIDPDEFLRLTRNTSSILDLDPHAPTLEGYLFPDTYKFEYHTSAAGVISAMEARFRQVLKHDFQHDFDGSGPRLHDTLTLASLVERETPDPNERPIVSQVFLLRLKKQMPLQCDPTVLYALALDRLPGGSITEGDLKLPSAYNTYVNTGLPPGPICNPGAASIRAALHPASTHYLYFVSNNHGGHVFATTIVDHIRNVEQYRRDVAAQQAAAQKASSQQDSSKQPATGSKH